MVFATCAKPIRSSTSSVRHPHRPRNWWLQLSRIHRLVRYSVATSDIVSPGIVERCVVWQGITTGLMTAWDMISGPSGPRHRGRQRAGLHLPRKARRESSVRRSPKRGTREQALAVSIDPCGHWICEKAYALVRAEGNLPAASLRCVGGKECWMHTV